jgi:hypothetical protein
MTVAANTLEGYSGKQVVLHVVNDENGLDELEGTVVSASEVGMAFKEKGKRDLRLIEPSQIEEIEVAPEAPKKTPQKKLQQVTNKSARQHLLDRHGYLRSWANEVSDDEAFAEHEGIDHSDLGHRHLTDEETAKKAAGKSDSEDED